MTTNQPSSLPSAPAEHLRGPATSPGLRPASRSVSDGWLIVYACENGLPHLRLGLSVSRKVGQADAPQPPAPALPRGVPADPERDADRPRSRPDPAGPEEPPLEELKRAVRRRWSSSWPGKLAREAERGPTMKRPWHLDQAVGFLAVLATLLIWWRGDFTRLVPAADPALGVPVLSPAAANTLSWRAQARPHPRRLQGSLPHLPLPSVEPRRLRPTLSQARLICDCPREYHWHNRGDSLHRLHPFARGQ